MKISIEKRNKEIELEAKQKKEAAEAQRQTAMNASAFNVCAPLWRAVAGLQTLEGAVYHGSALGGLPHGSGVWVLPGEDTYQGELGWGQPDGHGELRGQAGDRYCGEWARGAKVIAVSGPRAGLPVPATRA